MTKKIKNNLINEMLNFGTAYLGKFEIRGLAVCKEYKALAKEVSKQFNNRLVLCWDKESGEIWLA